MEACLDGTGDAVPNVRMKFASLLPTMKSTVRLPEDVALLERLNSAMASLTSDADADVAEAALKVADTFRATHVSTQAPPTCGALCAERREGCCLWHKRDQHNLSQGDAVKSLGLLQADVSKHACLSLYCLSSYHRICMVYFWPVLLAKVRLAKQTWFRAWASGAGAHDGWCWSHGHERLVWKHRRHRC